MRNESINLSFKARSRLKMPVARGRIPLARPQASRPSLGSLNFRILRHASPVSATQIQPPQPALAMRPTSYHWRSCVGEVTPMAFPRYRGLSLYVRWGLFGQALHRGMSLAMCKVLNLFPPSSFLFPLPLDTFQCIQSFPSIPSLRSMIVRNSLKPCHIFTA